MLVLVSKQAKWLKQDSQREILHSFYNNITIFKGCKFSTKMKYKAYHTVGTIIQSNIKIEIERIKIDTTYLSAWYRHFYKKWRC